MEKLKDTVFYSLENAIKSYRQFGQRDINRTGLDITIDQWLVLKTLEDSPGISQQHLAALVFKDVASITRITDLLVKKGIVRTILDPACGTGGMLAVADEYLRELNPDARLEVFGQDYNRGAYSVCGSDMLVKGNGMDHNVFDDSFTADGFAGQKVEYMLANPPFGVEWKRQQDAIEKERDNLGRDGRFGEAAAHGESACRL